MYTCARGRACWCRAPDEERVYMARTLAMAGATVTLMPMPMLDARWRREREMLLLMLRGWCCR